ncbi:STAS domain-containing protein [Streptomyces flavofungini]|uniref:STAS domain-containing protein n=1 Tax=Streptomyces flavofungini TaxID=68200 RepID=A0ABS0WXV2_9ACTN|nr:STAS domain-containing protein [Streptomyces flavofungini]MBJ3805762.1 STAS domain-containing protein [Streptomyces flavofungini]GHC71896.1 hypothetical protein GCM10010349_48470 [Streptomyces flavofungini]
MGPHPALFEECQVVRMEGELDLTTAPDLTRALERARDRSTGRLFLIVDLSRVTFMDGSVLTPLCTAWEDCRRRLGWIRLVHTGPGTSLVLRASGLADRFPRYASTRDAWWGVPADRAERHPAAADRPA